MKVRVLVSLLAAAIAWPARPARAQERVRLPVSPAPRLVAPFPNPWGVPTPASVLWIGAHPDDEAIAAPLFARWCRDGRARCSLLVATRGERGPCLLPAGCLPDLATVRSAEAVASAEFFGAELFLLSLPDGGGAAPPPWAPGTPGASDVVARLAAFVRAVAPELVLTFDPRHGTTCHPDHRAIGKLALEALALLDAPPPAFLLETRVDFDTEETAFRFAPAAEGAIRYDASEPLAWTAGPAWGAIEAVMQSHPSQFDPERRAAILRVPERDRSVFLAPAAAILNRPVATCP